MSIKNIKLTSGCSWGENFVSIPGGEYGMSEASFTRGEDGTFTFSAVVEWANRENSCAVFAQATDYRCGDAGDLFTVYLTTSGIWASLRNGSSYIRLSTGVNPVENTKYVIDVVVSTNSMEVYINGALTVSQSLTINTAESNLLFGINALCNESAAEAVNENSSIRVYAINFYNRNLSAEEIVTNFNTYNERYNLGL